MTEAIIPASPARRLACTIRRGAPVLLIVLGSMLYVEARFQIAINDQIRKCLPPYSVFLVDRHDREIRRGGIYAFFAGERMRPFFAPETMVIKRVVGGPGDRVRVTEQSTQVNGRSVGEGLDLAPMMRQSKAAFARTLEIPRDALWVMGDTRDSFDSRYWGHLPIHQIIGRAYALF